MRNARVLTAGAGASVRERLDELLPEALRDAAVAAADTAAVVVDAPGSGAGSAAAALRDAGAFADIARERLIACGSRGAFVAARERLDGAARALVDELVRALDADRTRAQSLRLRDRTLDFRSGAKVMGILNATPDSFYDRGAYRGLDAARARAAEMVAQGADVIDIGGRSYAASSPPVDPREERARVVPLIEALVRESTGVALSVDTVDCDVADAALAAGAHLLNDCSGLADPRLAEVAARYGAGLVVMHLKGELNVRAPQGYVYDDALGEVLAFLRERTERALGAGVAPEAILVDPGLEFGKETATDLQLLERFGDLRSLGYPVLLAASRKSFIARVFDRPPSDLLVPSLAAAALGVTAGASLVRTHDVAETVQLTKLLGAVTGRAALGYTGAMEHASTPAVPGQADPQDAGTDEAAGLDGSKDDSLGKKVGETLGLTDDSSEKIDDELSRPEEDRSPLT